MNGSIDLNAVDLENEYNSLVKGTCNVSVHRTIEQYIFDKIAVKGYVQSGKKQIIRLKEMKCTYSKYLEESERICAFPLLTGR